MTSELLTVAALPTTAEAEIVRGRLREAGVEAVLVEPETGANAAPSRVHVRVTPADFDRAMRVVFPIPQAVGSRQPAVGSEERTVGARQPAVAQPTAGAEQQTFEQPEAGDEQQAAGDEKQAVGSRRQAVKAEENSEPSTLEISEELTDPRSPNAAPFPTPEPRTLNPESPLSAGTRPMPESRLLNPEPLHIVVPAMEFLTAGSRIKTIEPTAIVDRAAKRAWWCAVAGIGICPLLVYPAWWTAVIAALVLPALVYAICVVHSIGLRNQALSRTGDRHFYGALGLVAVFIALTFAAMAMRQ